MFFKISEFFHLPHIYFGRQVSGRKTEKYVLSIATGTTATLDMYKLVVGTWLLAAITFLLD
jgi:hypothetical protein